MAHARLRLSGHNSDHLYTPLPYTGGMALDQLEYTVAGMTCGHCVAAVTEEVEQVPGVTGVSVELERGRVLVEGASVDDGAIRAAVEEAGYEVVAPSP